MGDGRKIKIWEGKWLRVVSTETVLLQDYKRQESCSASKAYIAVQWWIELHNRPKHKARSTMLGGVQGRSFPESNTLPLGANTLAGRMHGFGYCHYGAPFMHLYLPYQF